MSQSNRRYNKKGNNRIIAGLLAFIGGTFGVHKFYLGDIGGGIFYIFLFFITIKFFPVTLVLGIIEALKLFNMDPEAFDKKYNQGATGRSKRFQGKNRPQYRRDRERSNGNRNARVRSNGNNRNAPPRSRYSPKRNTILKRNPFKASAMEKYKEFDLEDAIVDFNKALKLAEQDPEIHFYLAAVYSLSENKDKAFKHIELAVKYGFKEPEKIETFEDLAYMRIQDDFEAFRDNGYKITLATESKKETITEDVLEDDILLSQLNKLDELRKRGLISNEEFQIEKEKLIDHRK